MALILRRVTRPNWYPGAGEGTRPDNEVAAEDLQPDTDGEVSVWEVKEGAVDRIIAAIAGSRGYLDTFDYVLFDDSHATKLGISITATNGDTPDDEANRTWHRNLASPSQAAILSLVDAIKAHSSNASDCALRKKKGEVLDILAASVKQQWIKVEDLSKQIRPKVEKVIEAARTPREPH